MEWRSHTFVKIVYVLKGRGTFHLGRESILFDRGDVVVVPPHMRNRIEDDPVSAASLYVCCISSRLLKFDPLIVPRLPAGRIGGDGHFANRVASLLRRMLLTQQRQHDLRPISMVANAMRLIELILQSDAGKTDPQEGDDQTERQLLQHYIQNLQSQFFEATTIEAAAETLGIPRRSFTKLFAEQTGQSWLQYVRCLAIGHAKERLRTTDVPIPSIAFECGFNDLSTFYRQFKSQVGKSPAKYRQAAQSS
jgi:AraC family L-rhamnose operon regulatory protein RhaS